MPVDCQRRIRLVAGEHKIDDLARCTQRRILQRPLRKDRRVAGCDGAEGAAIRGDRQLEVPGSTASAATGKAPRSLAGRSQVRSGLAAGGKWIRTIGTGK
jgi:hypothetical protein